MVLTHPAIVAPGRGSLVNRVGLTAASVVPLVLATPWASAAVNSSTTSYCLINREFGLLCPGCGLTHALVDVVHGSFVAGTRANALVWLYLSLIVLGWLAVLQRQVRAPRLVRQNVGWILLSTVGTFTVIRNL